VNVDREVTRVLTAIDGMVAAGFKDLTSKVAAPASVILAALEAVCKHRGHLVRLEGLVQADVEFKPANDNFLELAAKELQRVSRVPYELHLWTKWVASVWDTLQARRQRANKTYSGKRKRVTEELLKTVSEQGTVIKELRDTMERQSQVLKVTQDQVASQQALQPYLQHVTQQQQLQQLQQQQKQPQQQNVQARAAVPQAKSVPF